MLVKDLLAIIEDEPPVVLMEEGEDLSDITPNGDLLEAVEGECRDPEQYAERVVKSAAYKQYDGYRNALIVRLKACAA